MEQVFQIEVEEYQNLDGIKYSLYETSGISKPDDYTVLYGSVDPAINKTNTWRINSIIDDNDVSMAELPISTQVSPEEHKTFYLRTSFLKYGIYKLNIKAFYTYSGILSDTYKENDAPKRYYSKKVKADFSFCFFVPILSGCLAGL